MRTSLFSAVTLVVAVSAFVSGCSETSLTPDVDQNDPRSRDCELILDPADSVAIDEECLTPDVVVDDPWNATIEWQWSGLAAAPNVDDVIMTPVVGNLADTDGDGDIDTDDVPTIAFVAFDSAIQSGTLVVVSGTDGRELWTSPGWNGGGGIAIADVDADGISDVIGFDNGGRVRAMNANGTELWLSARVSSVYPQATVADLDADGTPEVIADNVVLDGVTGVLEFNIPVDSGIPYRLPAVGDLDLDGQQEVILGRGVYSSTGELLWTSPIRGTYGHWAAILNADSDPEAEVAMVGAGELAIYEHDGTEILRTRAGGGQPGAPCVADFDGDGAAEIAWGSSSTLNMYELDGRELWSASVDDSSGLASCSGYDVDGDGIYEVLFADQNTFHIFDGGTGVLRYSQGGHASGTLWEYPSVADVDGDGSAEIVIGSNNYGFSGWGGITVFGHAGGGWMKSGSTWHTHDFAVTNIRPDGSVPRRPTPWWNTYNVYRARPAVDTSATDLQVAITDVCEPGCNDEDEVSIAIQVRNIGGVEVPAGVPVTVYAFDGSDPEPLYTHVVGAPVRPGEALEAFSVTVTRAELAGADILVRVDAKPDGEGEHVECNEANNEDWYELADCE